MSKKMETYTVSNPNDPKKAEPEKTQTGLDDEEEFEEFPIQGVLCTLPLLHIYKIFGKRQWHSQGRPLSVRPKLRKNKHFYSLGDQGEEIDIQKSFPNRLTSL